LTRDQLALPQDGIQDGGNPLTTSEANPGRPLKVRIKKYRQQVEKEVEWNVQSMAEGKEIL